MRFIVSGRRVYVNMRWSEWLLGLTIDEVEGPDGAIGADCCLHIGPGRVRTMIRYAVVDDARERIARRPLRWFRFGRLWGGSRIDCSSWCVGVRVPWFHIFRSPLRPLLSASVHCGPIVTDVLMETA